MVAQPSRSVEIFNSPLKYVSVSAQEILESGYRLDASFYNNESRQAWKDLEKCRWDIVRLEDFIENAFYLGRFKRVYIDKGNGIPFILPSQITDIYPKAEKFISHKTYIDIQNTRVKQGQVLLTRSGRTGVVSYVSRTLKEKSLSDDIIRIETGKYSGYIYAYLRSKMGKLLLQTNNYGAVISHIEPKHLNNIPVPNPLPALKKKIHDLIEKSFRLRDESNELMDESQTMLKNALRLPDIETLHANAEYFDKEASVSNYSTSLSELDNRLDASYHIPVVREIEKHLRRNAKEVTHIGDDRISQSVILPGRFRRVYVEEGQGIVFFGGKQIYELDPGNKKYLSRGRHSGEVWDALKVHANTTLITRSGTIGKVNIVPAHWDNWIPNEHIIRVVPANDEIAGYVYAWLSSDYGYPLITRFTYGAVVDEIDDRQVLQISIPLLKDAELQKEINDKVLDANKKRAKAYRLEQETLHILNKEVIYAQRES